MRAPPFPLPADQGLFMTSQAYAEAGGFDPASPLLEDVGLVSDPIESVAALICGSGSPGKGRGGKGEVDDTDSEGRRELRALLCGFGARLLFSRPASCSSPARVVEDSSRYPPTFSRV